MSIFGDYPTFSVCLTSPCLCYFPVAVKPSAVQAWLCHGSCSSAPGQVLWAMMAQSPQVSLEVAVPTPPSLAFPELPCQRSLPCLTESCSISSCRQGVVAQLHLCLCLPSPLCQGHPALLPGLGQWGQCAAVGKNYLQLFGSVGGLA